MPSIKVPMEFHPEDPSVPEDQSNWILQGATRPFPGNASTTEYFQHSLVQRNLQSKVALIDEERQITFQELDITSSKIALAIHSYVNEKELKNYNPDNDWVIALCLPPSDELIFTMFAIHKLGAAYVPIDHTFPENRVISMVTNCRPILIISDTLSSTFSKFEPVVNQTEVISIDDLFGRAGRMNLEPVVPFPSNFTSLAERVAIVLYTSGSSGTPKGVRLTHRTIMNRLSWQWEVFPYTDDEKCCFKTAFTFVDSVAEIFGPLLRGIAINIFSKLTVTNPNLLIKKLHATQISRIVVVPSLLRALISTVQLLGSDGDKGREKLANIRLWVCSGETLTKDLLDDFFLHFTNGKTTLCNFYGSTEIMADVTYEVFSSAMDVEKQVKGIHVPIGSPVFNTILYVLNKEMGTVREGEIGELYVAGYNLGSGYVGMDNTDKFLDNPFSDTNGFNRLFRTGDFVRVETTRDGRQTLLYEGRSDSQVKVRGQRVDLHEIESVLNMQTDLVSTAFVFCYNAGQEDQALVSFVISARKEVTADEIKARAKETLKPYEIPEVRIISEVPLLVNGKVDRQRLLSSFDMERKATTGVSGEDLKELNIPPESIEKARILIEAIAEVTHILPMEIIEDFDDSFFNLGGTSLNSVVVVTKLRMKNLHIGLDDFVLAKSLREMVTKIRTTDPNAPSSIIEGSDSNDSNGPKYFSELLSEGTMTEAMEIIGYSFSRKGDLEVYTNASYQDFKDLVQNLYPVLMEKGLSFIVRRSSDKEAVAVALNFDLYDEPETVIAAPGIQLVLNFLDHIESRQRDKLPKGTKKIAHSFMMGTHEKVTVAENVPLIIFMEEEITRIAKERGFLGVMTTNTNPLTMQVCSELLGYETLVEYQVNQYKLEDGSIPFRLAPDTQTVNCCWKKL